MHRSLASCFTAAVASVSIQHIKNQIEKSHLIPDDKTDQVHMKLKNSINNEKTKRLRIHEAQHTIQNVEGFARISRFQRMLKRILQERALSIQQYKSLSAKEQDLIRSIGTSTRSTSSNDC